MVTIRIWLVAKSVKTSDRGETPLKHLVNSVFGLPKIAM